MRRSARREDPLPRSQESVRIEGLLGGEELRPARAELPAPVLGAHRHRIDRIEEASSDPAYVARPARRVSTAERRASQIRGEPPTLDLASFAPRHAPFASRGEPPQPKGGLHRSGAGDPPREADGTPREAKGARSGVDGASPVRSGRRRAQRSSRSIRIPVRLEMPAPRSTPRGRRCSLTIDAVPGGWIRARPSGIPPGLPSVCGGEWQPYVPHDRLSLDI
jgi:hypothetical protein